MAEQEAVEIREEQVMQYKFGPSWITFGNGVSTDLMDSFVKTSPEGLKGFTFVMRPTPKLIRRYGIREKDYKNGTITRWYSKDDVVEIDKERMIILCGFEGERDTALLRHFIELRDEVEVLRKQVRFWQLRSGALGQDNYFLGIANTEKIKRDVDAYNLLMDFRRTGKDEEKKRYDEDIEE